MKKSIPTLCGLLAGFLFGAYHLFFSFEVHSPFSVLLYAVIGALIGFGVGAFLPRVMAFDSKGRKYVVLSISCLGHAGVVTAFASLDDYDNYIFLWGALSFIWLFWVVVFWKFGWRLVEIVLAMILGLLVLYPAVVKILIFFLVFWKLAHGGSLA